ncbi:GNAT family N-acetyltransferase [Amycolatopsis magusensis]|uniref:GNAT family N-acetyltransferase n=1 Tax=Amycolatopsis magusensis TaxID=882444 RepID=UPI0024A97A5C|nr:GNAT family N-acetyltransferase [Amycolatopsis magusensis]MDI5977565.1 GNAT family N-acetyltransferase [Amycolatopsis magusensis]
MTQTLVHRVGPEELDRAAVAVAEAFFDEVVTEWVIPDPVQRKQLMPLHLRDLVEKALEQGEVLATADFGAISLWLDRAAGESGDAFPGGELDIPPELAEFVRRGLIVAELTEARHPTHTAHVYLPCIGALPAYRGQGLGSALLRDKLERADAANLPVYLEASSTRNRALYARHGFEALGDPIRFPEDGPEIHPMWREPSAQV